MDDHVNQDAGRICRLAAVCLLAGSLFGGLWTADAATPATGRPRDYRFERTISREVLEDYLDRSVTMAYFLVTGEPEGNREYRYRDDDVRLIQNIGAKFIGRAI